MRRKLRWLGFIIIMVLAGTTLAGCGADSVLRNGVFHAAGQIYGLRFEANTKGRRAGVEDTASHYRKGVAGDWENHFDDEVTATFREVTGDLLEALETH